MFTVESSGVFEGEFFIADFNKGFNAWIKKNGDITFDWRPREKNLNDYFASRDEAQRFLNKWLEKHIDYFNLYEFNKQDNLDTKEEQCKKDIKILQKQLEEIREEKNNPVVTVGTELKNTITGDDYLVICNYQNEYSLICMSLNMVGKIAGKNLVKGNSNGIKLSELSYAYKNFVIVE